MDITMTDGEIALQDLREKSSGASLLREMIGLAAQRLMALETDARCMRHTAKVLPNASTIATASATATGRRLEPQRR